MNIHDFTVNEHGFIQNPGKFECEPLWVPYFWDLALEGEGEEAYSEPNPPDEEADAEYTFFIVDAGEAETFGIPAGSKVCLREYAQGFVTGWIEAVEA